MKRVEWRVLVWFLNQTQDLDDAYNLKRNHKKHTEGATNEVKDTNVSSLMGMFKKLYLVTVP